MITLLGCSDNGGKFFGDILGRGAFWHKGIEDFELLILAVDHFSNVRIDSWGAARNGVVEGSM
jgi:hypothetical protein